MEGETDKEGVREERERGSEEQKEPEREGERETGRRGLFKRKKISL